MTLRDRHVLMIWIFNKASLQVVSCWASNFFFDLRKIKWIYILLEISMSWPCYALVSSKIRHIFFLWHYKLIFHVTNKANVWLIEDRLFLPCLTHYCKSCVICSLWYKLDLCVKLVCVSVNCSKALLTIAKTNSPSVSQ